MRTLWPGTRLAAVCGAALLVSVCGPAGAATQRLEPGTYRQIDTVTKKALPGGSQIVLIAGKGGRLGFSVNAIRQTDAEEGFVAGVLPDRLPAVWQRTSAPGKCRLTFEAARVGIKVTQDAAFGDCGFGAGVSADGTYALVAEKPPRT